MVDYANDNGVRQSYLVPYCVDIVFNFVPVDKRYIRFSYFFYNLGQLCTDMATPIYMIKTVCLKFNQTIFFYLGTMVDYAK